MRHYVYKIEIPGTYLYYIGKRSSETAPELDKYRGSGIEVMKYKSRVKSILEECVTSDEAYLREKEILGDKWKTDPLCLNQKPGGKGAPLGKDHHWFGKPSAYRKVGKDHHAFGKSRPSEVCKKISEGLETRLPETYLRGEEHPGFGKERPNTVRDKISSSKVGKKTGPQTSEHRNKISEKLKAYTRPLVTCEWCQKTMDASNATRYHGMNCKLNPSVQDMYSKLP